MSLKLATFKIDEDKWKAFQEVAEAENSSASAMLKDFINWVIAGNRLKNEEADTPDIDHRIDSKLAAIKEEILEQLRGELAA